MIAFSTTSHTWAGPPPDQAGAWAQLEPTLYTIGIILCLALLLIWYGAVRRPG